MSSKAKWRKLQSPRGWYLVEQTPDPVRPDSRKVTTPDGLTYTGRQIEILAGIAEGFSRKEIAERLHVSEDAVTSSLYWLYKRNGFRSATEAVMKAMRRGLLDPLAIVGLETVPLFVGGRQRRK